MRAVRVESSATRRQTGIGSAGFGIIERVLVMLNSRCRYCFALAISFGVSRGTIRRPRHPSGRSRKSPREQARSMIVTRYGIASQFLASQAGARCWRQTVHRRGYRRQRGAGAYAACQQAGRRPAYRVQAKTGKVTGELERVDAKGVDHQYQSKRSRKSIPGVHDYRARLCGGLGRAAPHWHQDVWGAVGLCVFYAENGFPCRRSRHAAGSQALLKATWIPRDLHAGR
jgi:hypothetical protein